MTTDTETKLSTEQALERAQAVLERLNRAHADIETQAIAKHLDACLLKSPDAREAAQLEAHHLERRGRGLRNRLVVAVLEVHNARLEHTAAEEHARELGVPAAGTN